jgi:hypothetical protein
MTMGKARPMDGGGEKGKISDSGQGPLGGTYLGGLYVFRERGRTWEGVKEKEGA